MDDSQAARILLQFALQSPEHAVILLDPEGRVTWWNSTAEEIFGYTADEVLGKPAAIIFTTQDVERGVPEWEMESAFSRKGAEDDRWQRRKDGSRFWASGVLCALRDEAGTLTGYAKVLRNRTDQRELFESLRNKATALEAGAKRQEAFLSTLAHELANPLAPLVNAASIIRQAGPAKEEVDYALRVIERQTQLLRTLVSDLMEFSRLGVGKVELKLARVSLHDVIDQAAQDCRALVEQRRHELRLVLTRAPIHVNGDAERLHQVLVNLITNAAKYTNPGGSITIKAATEGDEGVVRVEDTGVGISHDMLPRIFELFTQVEATRPMSQGGLGIGLALVKELVEMHGGTVQVMSEGRGKGSQFSVRLPLARDDRQAGPEPSPGH